MGGTISGSFIGCSGTLVRLTLEGKRIVDRAMPRHLANMDRLLRSLRPGQRLALEELLRTLLRDLEHD